MTKILVIGKGRMGNKIVEYLEKKSEYQILQVDFVAEEKETKQMLEKNEFDIIIDFSNPYSIHPLSQIKFSNNPAFIIGTTGYNELEMNLIKKLSNKYRILIDSNFSKGIHLLRKILSENMINFGEYHPSILEAHHQKKLDTPSGTAILLASVINPKIKIHSYRVGDELGTHEVILKNDLEEIRFIHKVKSSELFIRGIASSIKFMLKATPGLYGFLDVINHE